MKDLIARYKASRLGRTLDRYGQRNGAVLAGGVAYAALFSIFGALVAAFSVFGLLLGNNQALFDAVVRATSEAIPGLLDVDGSGGVLDPNDLAQSNLFSTTGIIAFLAALFAGLGWVGALRDAVREMFDIPHDARNVVVKKLLDVVWLASLGLALLSSAVLSMGLTSIGGAVLDAMGLSGSFSRLVVRVLGFALVVAVNAAVLVIVFRWLAGLKLPFVRLRGPVVVGGLLLTVLTQFSGVFVGSVGGRNPLLATGAVLVTLLVLFNLMSRIMLYVGAWVATFDDPAPLEAGPSEAVDLSKPAVERQVQRELVAAGAGITAAEPEKVPVPGGGERELVRVSVRSQDRAVAAAGMVLGATAVIGIRLLREGFEAAVDLVRPR